MKPTLFSAFFKIVFCLGMVFFSSVSGAQTIASWNFNALPAYPTPTANPAPTTGVGTASVVNPIPAEIITPSSRTGMEPAGTGCGPQDGVAGNSAWALEPFNPGSSNESNGVQFNASTTGLSNIGVVWDMRFSNTAANTCRLQYTTNGSTWTNFGMTAANTTICNGSITSGCFKINTGDVFARIIVNMSAITALNNNASFGVRMVAAWDPAASQFRQALTPANPATTTGTWRFDNVTIKSLGTIPTNTVFAPAGTIAICYGSSTTLKFSITPLPLAGETFTIVYKDNFGNNFTLNNYTNLTAVSVSPIVNTTYSLVSIVNSNNISGVVSAISTRTVTINAQPTAASLGYSVSDYQSCSSTGSTVLATGFPPTTFTVGATNYTATYSPALPYTSTGNTSFSVTIKNLTTLCTWTSPTYTFTKYAAPGVVTQPATANQSTCVGTSFSPISVVASGFGPLYQWYSFDGTTNVAIAGATSASYTPQSTALGTLQYYVKVTGYCTGQVNSSYSGNFTVNAPAVSGTIAAVPAICIGSQPANLVLSGQTGGVVKWQRADDLAFTAGVADIASTATTLTGATIGPLSQTTYFRAYIQNGTCNAITVPVQVLVKSTTYHTVGGWNNGLPDNVTSAVFDDDFLSTGNINACSVVVLSGNVTIDTGHVLTVENGVNVSGGTMTFENNSSLVQVNNAVNSGNITYKRQTLTPIGKYDYTYWSSPVFGQTLSAFSPTTLPDKYFWFNPVTYIWNAVAVPGLTAMTPGQGYIIRGPQGNAVPALWQGSFYGVPNNGDYTPQISGTNSVVFTSTTQNMNCLGNPYPSALSADAFMAGNAATLGTGTALYFWTHNTPITGNLYNSNDYAVYNYTGGVGTIQAPAPGVNVNVPNGKIAAGQGFMIKAIATGTVTFTNAMRLSGPGDNNQFFRHSETEATSDINRSRIWLELKNDSGAFKQTLVGYLENAGNGFDDGYDAEIVEAGNPVSLYSVLNDKKLSIQGRALPFEISDEVSLGIKISAPGMYNIGISNLDGVFDDPSIGIFIDDQLLNTSNNLREGNYSFASEAGVFENRFVLRYTSSALSTAYPTPKNNTVVVYSENQKIVVHSGIENMQSIRIYDSLGRLILSSNDVNKGEFRFDTPLKNQVMLIEITTSNGEIINKKYLN